MSQALSYDLDDIKRVLKLLAEHFGQDCEIVLHDFTNGFDSSIIAIENGQVTGRSIGSSITARGLEALTGDDAVIGDGFFNYFSTTPDGRILRCSTVVQRDEAGQIRSSICINQDITKLRITQDALRAITGYDAFNDSHEVFFQNVDQLMTYYISECTRLVGRTPTAMNKEELARAIRFLAEKGVFRITKAGEKVCGAFGITKYQLYRQLEAIRNPEGGE